VVSASPHPWIVGPWFDHFFVVGGIVWILMITHFVFFGWNTAEPHHAQLLQAPGTVNVAVSQWLIIAGLLGAHLFSDSHTAATYMRVYATPESRKQFKLYATYLPFLSLSLLIVALNVPAIAGVVVYVHMMWFYQHYTSQSFGISLIYCCKRGYFLSKFERETFRWMMLFMSFYAISRILCFREFSPREFYGVSLPFWAVPEIVSHACRFAFIGLTGVFVFIVVRKFFSERKLIPVPSLMVVLSVAAIGLSVGFANSMWWLYGAAFFHGSQYCAVALAFYLKEKGVAEGADSRTIAKSFMTSSAFKWYGLVIISGVFIYVGVPHFLENFGIKFVIGATCIQACLNLHHFVTDAAIWKLSDPHARKLLV
jgi:hypothetical protein